MGRVVFQTDHLVSEARAAASRATRKVAFATEGRAKQKARVDTGAYRASIYVSTGNEDTYDESVAAAREKNPKVDFVPRVPVETSPTRVHAVVGPSVNYGLAREVGSRGQPGDATMADASANNQQELEALLSAELKAAGF